MLVTKAIAHVALATLLFCTSSLAAPYYESRDESTSGPESTTEGPPPPALEPIVPPDIDQDSLSILKPDTGVVLAWAGSNAGPATSSTTGPSAPRRMLKRDNGILAQAALTFRYPTVPLDHASFISGISCFAGILTGTLSDSAYAFARKQWEGAPNILFITSVDGCGSKDENDYFHATSITFSSTDKSFTAKGQPAPFKDVAARMSLKWGDIGSMSVKRAINKRDMFEPHSLDKRISVTLDWHYYLDDEDHLGADEDAPWDQAALLYKWGKEGGKENDGYKKGEVADPNGHHKRSNETSLDEYSLEKREFDYGLALYCVECGFGGSATIWGEIDVDIFPWPSLERVQVGFQANFKAGLNLGMVAYVSYKKEWEKRLGRVTFGGFSIPFIVEVGPFVSVSIKAEVGISATGSLLIGAAVAWDDIDIMLDLMHPSNSHSRGLVPRFEHKAEAKGELKLEASLGLPVKLGVGVSIVGGLLEADAAIVDTPSINAEGTFEVSAVVTDDGTVETDINGGCYGIAWDIHFENKLQAVLECSLFDDAIEFDLIEPQKSDPIAEGCIGYVNDGTKDDDDAEKNPQGTGAGTGAAGNGMNSGGKGLSGKNVGSGDKSPGTTTTTTLTTTTKSTTTTLATTTSKPTSTTTIKTSTTTQPASTCTPSTSAAAKTKAPSGATCKKTVKQAKVNDKFKVGKAAKMNKVELCAYKCLKNKDCVSFTYDDKKSCQFYNKAVKSVPIVTTKGEPQLMFWDKSCFGYNTCQKK